MENKHHKLFLAAFCIIASSYCMAGQPEVGKVPFEDLSNCIMQNGIQELPKKGSPKARKYDGYIFKFNKKSLNFDPLMKKNKRPGSFKEFRDAILAEKTGDIYFDSWFGL